MPAPQTYIKVKAKEVMGRYVPPEQITSFLKKNLAKPEYLELGFSVEKRPVYGVRLGSGPVRVLMWSQMHGNESTTTRALLDLINSFRAGVFSYLEGFTLMLIPQLNPDGAYAYTRQNASGVDLNRDARDLSQPESRILRKAFEDFAPQFCFNLHDQRTLFSAGNAPLPATLSFLAPACGADKGYSASRKAAARLIGDISKALPGEIGIGRYDDTFNPDCVGDAFQAAGTPTVLVEAGHYPGDYGREQTRYYVYQALCNALQTLSTGDFQQVSLQAYESIPENEKRFFDILVSNAHLLGPSYPEGSRLGIRYEEVLEGGRIHYRPRVEEVGPLQDFFGHLQRDAKLPQHLRELKSNQALAAIF